MEDKKVQQWLSKILHGTIIDAFFGHRGRKGKRGGSMPRTEHTTKQTNAQYESEAGTSGLSISKIINNAKEHVYTSKEHKNLKDRSLILISGDQIPGSKFKGMQLYRYNKKDKRLESNYGDAPTLLLKDLKGKKVRTFQPTYDVKNQETKFCPLKKRVADARKESFEDRKSRLKHCATVPTHMEQEALNYYTGPGYITFNGWLRNNHVNADNGKILQEHEYWGEEMNRLTKYLSENTLEQDTTLYRNSDYSALAGQYSKVLEAAHLEMNNKNIEACLKAMVGKVGHEMGFLSTTAQEENFGVFRKIHIEIFAPKGTHAAYIDHRSVNEGEEEVLGQRGMKLLCTGFRKVTKNGNTIFYVQQQIVN